MSEVFGQGYAGVYDALYQAKDYEGETDLIERILAAQGESGPRRILDLGCGTGNHALPLARRGHAVAGVDRSAAMLTLARNKAAALAAGVTPPAFHEGDIRDVDLGQRFAAVLMMFAVLGYLHEQADVLAALKTVRRHLKEGGLFIFDVWNGTAVMAERPGERSVTVADGSARITRKTQARLDAPRHLCHVFFDVERVDGGKSEKWTEEHVMRFYFPDELESTLRDNGFNLLQLRRFPDGEAAPDEKAWNVIGVARA